MADAATLSPKTASAFQANLDRAAPLLKQLKADGIGHLIGGEIVAASSSEVFETDSPIDNTVLAQVARGTAADIDRAWRHSGVGSVHVTQPAAVSLTQLTEAGTIYTPAELGAIGEACGIQGAICSTGLWHHLQDRVAHRAAADAHQMVVVLGEILGDDPSWRIVTKTVDVAASPLGEAAGRLRDGLQRSLRVELV